MGIDFFLFLENTGQDVIQEARTDQIVIIFQTIERRLICGLRGKTLHLGHLSVEPGDLLLHLAHDMLQLGPQFGRCIGWQILVHLSHLLQHAAQAILDNAHFCRDAVGRSRTDVALQVLQLLLGLLKLGLEICQRQLHLGRLLLKTLEVGDHVAKMSAHFL